MNNNFTLLYVEDDEILLENFTVIFKNYFQNVISTNDGNKALKLYKNNTVDVAILDISIYGMNGLNLATKIREHDQNTIILIISAYSDKEKLLQAIHLNLLGYLVKPVKSSELKEKLNLIRQTLLQKTLITLSSNYFWNINTQHLLYNDNIINLTKYETKTIQVLLENKNDFLNACDIHDILFPQKEPSDDICNNVTQLLSRLKKKLLKISQSEDYFIQNCYGVGYKINLA